MYSVAIIGVGRVGGALALSLPEKQYRVTKLFSRTGSVASEIAAKWKTPPMVYTGHDFRQISEDIVFITTRDSEIPTVAGDLSQCSNLENSFVFHTSGSLSSGVLSGLSAAGSKTGSIHPLVSISNPQLGSERFEGAYFCIEGSQEAVVLAEQVVRDLKGIPFSIPTESKALYHAAAVTACGHLVALTDIAADMLSKCGLSKDEAQDVLMPLIESTVKNLKEQKPSDALTGTFARGDVGTFEEHMRSFEGNVGPEEIEIYLKLGKHSLELASKALEEEKLSELRRKITEAETKLKAN